MAESKTVIETEKGDFKRAVRNLDRQGWRIVNGSVVMRFEHVGGGSNGPPRSSCGEGLFVCTMTREKPE
jgi:hypothetical protein